MALWSSTPLQLMLGLLFLLLLLLHPITTTTGIHVNTAVIHRPSRTSYMPEFREAPAFRNGDECGSQDAHRIHIAMTLDVNYLRGFAGRYRSLLDKLWISL
ncbi:hypothetical protein Pint_24971 [Pistacia integerrima]|uniref:Uncharacterized protein n=1 Tax=Pistacia integerrima TaxID=434235 RepID=A0ACC0YGX1_9ROSI|nr:hypothetical protein Pint_24971 [Pistacia integerrima]